MESNMIRITEMAKYRNVTSETLRHYDRIGILKPDYIDENNVRYYSVLQYEKLGTIKELQQLGLSLKEIREYLDNRNIETSYQLLMQQQGFIKKKLEYYIKLKKQVDKKLSFINSLNDMEIREGEVKEKNLMRRYYLKSDIQVYDEESLGYACMSLEKKIVERGNNLLIYASECYAGYFEFERKKGILLTDIILLFDKKDGLKGEKLNDVPEGKYCYIYSRDTFWERKKVCEKLEKYASEHEYRLDDKIIAISKIDYTITDVAEERLWEFQVRILQ